MMSHLRLLLLFILIQQAARSQIGYDTSIVKRYGIQGYYNEGYSIIQLSADSFFLSLGYNNSAGTYCNWRPRLFMINANCDSTWSSFSVPGNGQMIRTSDGNFAGVTEVHHPTDCGKDTMHVFRFKLTGEVIWSRKFFYGNCNNQVTRIIETNDGGLAVLGFFSVGLSCPTTYNTALIKLTSAGVMQWTKFFGSTGESMEGIGLVQASNGDFGIWHFSPVCSVRSYSSYQLIRTTSTGDILWTKEHLIGRTVAGYGDLALLPDNSFLAAGSSTDSIFLSRVSPAGNTTLLSKYASMPLELSFAIRKVKYLPEKKAYLFMSNRPVITDTAGNIKWIGRKFDTNISSVSLHDAIITSNKDLITLGYVQENLKENVFLVKYKDTVKQAQGTGAYQVRVYPNPSIGLVRVSFGLTAGKVAVRLYNALGQLLYSKDAANVDHLDIDLARYPAAVYFLNVVFDDKQAVNKLIKL